MDDIIKTSPPQKSANYGSLSESHINKIDEEDKHLFDYKKMFDQSCTQIGVSKPSMGGAGYRDKILGGFSRADTGEINVSVLGQKPMVNLLHISGIKQRGVLTRYLYYGYITTSRETPHFYPSLKEVKKNVLADQKVHQAIQETVHATRLEQLSEDNLMSPSHLEKKLQRKAVSILDEMAATVTSATLKFCGWLFLTLLRQLSSAVHIHQGQMDVLKLILQDDKPVIYFPLHFSHFDYILLSLIMYHNELRSPFVASGNNLLIQPFSYIMRRVGGFFIRRKIDDGNDKDYVYRAVLHSYFTELLKNKQSLEIFIEGTRSRSGLPHLPKTGLLSVAVEALFRGDVEDINFVPVCISYEKVLEGTFRNELMGQAKKPETFVSSVTSICKMLFGYYGHIRVNFGVPQSMKKTLHELTTSPSCAFSSGTSPKMPSLYDQVSPKNIEDNKAKKTVSAPEVKSVESLTNGMLVNARHHSHMMAEPDSSPLIHMDTPTDEQTRELVTYLGERIVYSSLRCKVFMSTNLVAFLLLHRWRNGVTLPQLVESFRQLTNELFSRKSDVGFSGDSTDVVLHALDLLGSDLVVLGCTSTNKMKRSTSCLSLRSRRSADSGYDLEDPGEGSMFEKSSPQAVSGSKAPSGSDSGEEMYWSEQEETFTGNYMAATESGTFPYDFFSQNGQHNLTIHFTKQSHMARCEKPDITLCIEPVLRLPLVFDLTYYANALVPLFALESIVALAVGAVMRCRFSTLEKKLQILTADSPSGSVKIDVDDLPESVSRSFMRSRLVEKACELIDLLQVDLFLCDVTKNLDEAVSEALDSLVSSGCLVVEECGNSAATRNSQAARELGFDENECDAEQWMKVNLEQLPTLFHIQSVMSSFVEGYVASATQLTSLLNQPLLENELRKKMLVAAQIRVNDGLALRSESSSSDIIRNAIRSFEWNGILIKDEVNKKLYQLSDDFKDTESLSNLVSRISQFLL